MISVAIVAARRNLRDGWESVVETMSNAQCIGVFPTLTSLLKKPLGCFPDVIIFGLESRDDNFADLQTTLAHYPNVNILVLAAKIKEDQLFGCLRVGVKGYLEQKNFPSHLQEAIIELYQGGTPMSKAASKLILASFRVQRHSDGLSEREQEVYQLLCDGKNYREIAEALFVSFNTVRFHIKNIYKKLGVNSRHEAMRLAYIMGER